MPAAHACTTGVTGILTRAAGHEEENPFAVFSDPAVTPIAGWAFHVVDDDTFPASLAVIVRAVHDQDHVS